MKGGEKAVVKQQNPEEHQTSTNFYKLEKDQCISPLHNLIKLVSNFRFG